jgi:hypothetical protein
MLVDISFDSTNDVTTWREQGSSVGIRFILSITNGNTNRGRYMVCQALSSTSDFRLLYEKFRKVALFPHIVLSFQFPFKSHLRQHIIVPIIGDSILTAHPQEDCNAKLHCLRSDRLLTATILKSCFGLYQSFQFFI